MKRAGPWAASVVWVCLISAMPHVARACSVGTGVWEQDFAQALASSHEVFVARLVSFHELPPLAGDTLYLNQVEYELVEIIKGRPNPYGTLVEINPYHPIEGHPPGPSCGPFLAMPSAVGTTAVVFAYREPKDGKPYLWASGYSRQLDVGNRESDAMLDLIRHLQHEKDTAQ